MGRGLFVTPIAGTPRDFLDGLLLVDKPAGVTSHDVVAAVRRRFRQKKVGHGGTLDPMATGLLILLLGRGTKLSPQVMGADKEYEGVLRLGVRTDSLDVDGRVLEEKDVAGVTREQIEAAMAARVGDQMQTPPMVSAVKVAGVPLYKLARKGKDVEREPRLIHVYRFDLRSFDLPQAAFSLVCTKGTYVRSLVADIGDEIGCGAMLEKLRRTASGAIRIEQAAPLDAILAGTLDDLAGRLLPLHAALPGPNG